MDINIIIDDIKKRINKLTSHFPYTKYERNLLVISYIAIVSVDYDIVDILDDVLSRVFILFNNGTFDKLLESLTVPLDSVGSYQNNSDENKFINVNTYLASNVADLIDTIIHEIKHAMNSVIKAKTNNASYCGLAKETDPKKNVQFFILDETFNSYISAIYSLQVLRLKRQDVKDSDIRKILDSIQNYPVYPYKCTKLLQRIYSDEECFRLFYNAVLFRDINPLFNMLNKVFFDSLGNQEANINELEDKLEDYEYQPNPEIERYFYNRTQEYPRSRVRIAFSIPKERD